MGILGSVLGIVVLLIIAVLFSNNRKAINLRTVLGALAIQIGFAALILYVPFGRDALQATANGGKNREFAASFISAFHRFNNFINIIWDLRK